MTFSQIARCVTVTVEEREFDFREELGISLSIPANAVGERESVKLFVLPAFSGPFATPDDIESVSPAYLIKADREIKFNRDITVEIQHCANLPTDSDCHDLVLMRANSVPLHRGPLFGPLYVFHEMKMNSVKFDNKPFGELKVDQFSLDLLMIGRKHQRRGSGEDGLNMLKSNSRGGMS